MAERYKIIRQLGQGGVGAIFMGYDTHLKRHVAIKRLLPQNAQNLDEDTSSESLTREAEALSQLQHPNVVTLFEFKNDRKGPFVVTELIDGENLEEVVTNKGALTVTDFLELVNQILDALVAAEQIRLMHRDIKPTNLMLTFLPSGRFQVKVLDFGLSKFCNAPSTQTTDHKGLVLGSIDYIAPEQIEREQIDHRADLYSFGCVCYFALTQRSPFAGNSPAGTVDNHLNHRVIPVDDIRDDLPANVADWVMSLISRAPNDRPENASAAMVQLQKIINDLTQPIQSHPRPPGSRTSEHSNPETQFAIY